MIKVCSLLVVALLLSACGPRQLGVQVQGLEPLHLNEYDESTSVNVRFYQLKHDGKFRDMAFDAIWVDPKTSLEGDLADEPKEITVFPHAPEIKLDPRTYNIGAMEEGTQFVGILAMYRQDGGQTDQRRLVIPIKELKGVCVYCYDYVISTEKPIHLFPKPKDNSSNGAKKKMKSK